MNTINSKIAILLVFLALCVVFAIIQFHSPANGKKATCERLMNHYFADTFTHFNNANVTFLALKYYSTIPDKEIKARLQTRSSLYDFAADDKEIFRAVGFRNTLRVIGGALFLAEENEGEIPVYNHAHQLEVLAIYCLAYDIAIWFPVYFKPYMENVEWQNLFGGQDYHEEIERLANNIIRSFERVNSSAKMISDLPPATFLEIYGAGFYGKTNYLLKRSLM